MLLQYFYGTRAFPLYPYTFEVPFDDLVICKIGADPLPAECLPYGMKPEDHRTKVSFLLFDLSFLVTFMRVLLAFCFLFVFPNFFCCFCWKFMFLLFSFVFLICLECLKFSAQTQKDSIF